MWVSLQRFLQISFFLSIFGVLWNVCYGEPNNNTQITIISGATVIDSFTGQKAALDIIIKNDQITAIQAHRKFDDVRESLPSGVKVINATGLYAIPGLWDMHVHMTFLSELADNMPALLIANGVTSVRDMGGQLDDILAFRRQIQETEIIAPNLYIAGPLMDGKPPVFDGVHYKPAISATVETPEEAIQMVDRLVTNGVDVIKPYDMIPPAAYLALIKRAHKHGLKVQGHLPLRVTLRQALDAGLDGIEHLSGLPTACSRNPKALLAERISIMDTLDPAKGAVHALKIAKSPSNTKALTEQDTKQCVELIETLVKKGIWVTPTITGVARQGLDLYSQVGWLSTYQYLPRSLRATWKQKVSNRDAIERDKKSSPYTEWAQKIVGQMAKAGVNFLAGTDTPSGYRVPGFSLHDELQALVYMGLTPLQALQAATINPARFFDQEKSQGSIDVGKVADILLLNADPLSDIQNSRNINTVISRGRVFDRATLDVMLEDMKNR